MFRDIRRSHSEIWLHFIDILDFDEEDDVLQMASWILSSFWWICSHFFWKEFNGHDGYSIPSTTLNQRIITTTKIIKLIYFYSNHFTILFKMASFYLKISISLDAAITLHPWFNLLVSLDLSYLFGGLTGRKYRAALTLTQFMQRIRLDFENRRERHSLFCCRRFITPNVDFRNYEP